VLLIQTVSSMADTETAGRQTLIAAGLASTALLTSLVGRPDRQHLEVEIKPAVTIRASTTLDFRSLCVLVPEGSGRSRKDGIIGTHARGHDEGHPVTLPAGELVPFKGIHGWMLGTRIWRRRRVVGGQTPDVETEKTASSAGGTEFQ
jgi:hypothetical protein